MSSSSQPAKTGVMPPSTAGTSTVDPSVPTTRPADLGVPWPNIATKARAESGDHHAASSTGVQSRPSRACCAAAGTAAPVTRSVSTGPRATQRPSGESDGVPRSPEPSGGRATLLTAPTGEIA